MKEKQAAFGGRQQNEPVQFGAFRLWGIQTGIFRLDGGAMFGVVPKTLWSRKLPADDRNRITMGVRALLIQSLATSRIYLIDTGVGSKFDDKFNDIYGVDFSAGDLISGIQSAGFDAGDISDIIFTHLHFDHCGGTTGWSSGGSASEILFPNARLWVHEEHWKTAIRPNPREKASFLRENLEPLGQSANLKLISDDHRYEDDLSALVVNGHTLGQQLPVLSHKDKKIVFAADLFPTFAHIPVPWVMGYDMFPVTTMEERTRLLARATDEEWYFFMEHDAENELVQAGFDGRNYAMKSSLPLSGLQGL